MRGGSPGVLGAWTRTVPAARVSPQRRQAAQMGAMSRVGERVGCELRAGEVFVAVGGCVGTELPGAATSPRGCCTHPARPGVSLSQPRGTRPG